MNNYTKDFFSENIDYWKNHIPFKRDENLRYLEVGVFEGKSLLWVLRRFQNAEAVAIDPLEDGIWNVKYFNKGELHEDDTIVVENLEETLNRNISEFGSRVNIMTQKSQKALQSVEKNFDFIYIDGSHRAEDAIIDCCLAFMKLKSGGMMILDDDYVLDENNAKKAYDFFLETYSDYITWEREEEIRQVFVTKEKNFMN